MSVYKNELELVHAVLCNALEDFESLDDGVCSISEVSGVKIELRDAKRAISSIESRLSDIMADLDISGDVDFAVDALGTLLSHLGGEPPVDHFPDLAEAIGGSYVRD
jgi:hypothetical protein